MLAHPSPDGDAPGSTDDAHPRRGLSVRSRVLFAMLSLTALGLLVAGGSAFVLQRAQVDDEIDAALDREVTELAQFARDGTNPETGSRFTEASDLVYAAMQATATDTNEGLLGIVNGEIRWTAPEGSLLRLEDDPELVRLLVAKSTRDTVLVERTVTAMADYRYVVIPVQGESTPAALVVAFDRGAQHAKFNQIFRTYALVALAVVILIGIVGWFVAGRLLRPIRLLAQTAQHISDGDLSLRVPVTGRDDLAALAGTVNDMLGRLEKSFTGQRKLLDDVGHELRTPLTIVRGHLELMDASDAEEVRATRDLALDEVARMQGLVNDLMVLATASHPEFLQTTPTDLGRLTDDVLDKLRGLADRRWIVDSRAEVWVRVDPQRITQALLQLGANAVRHTQPGAVIAIGSELQDVPEDPSARLWIRDEGVGIEPEDLERIFERFSRGRNAPPVSGTGLGFGLAIVTAITQAHDGEVLVDSVPGQGSTFSLVLPATNLDRHDFVVAEMLPGVDDGSELTNGSVFDAVPDQEQKD